MSGNLVRLTLATDPEITCKDTWRFTLEPLDGDDYRIVELQVSGQKGCQGHPKTIATLLRGRRISEVSLENLSETDCARHQSCGQTLGKVLEELKKNLETH
ncbi:MAG: TSCPD domain-containing protein [Anaerolineaceae bacterium]|nr:TSCPD domain-containing protein [Anaerolineaceae bacterium]